MSKTDMKSFAFSDIKVTMSDAEHRIIAYK